MTFPLPSSRRLQNLKARYIDPDGSDINQNNYRRVMSLAVDEGIELNETFGSEIQRRQVLRHAMSVGRVMEYFNCEVRDDPNKDLRSIHKLEMTPPCLLHAELRIGENLLTQFVQRVMNRVKLLICNDCQHIFTIALTYSFYYARHALRQQERSR